MLDQVFLERGQPLREGGRAPSVWICCDPRDDQGCSQVIGNATEPKRFLVVDLCGASDVLGTPEMFVLLSVWADS